MIRIIIDEAQKKQLLDSEGTVELCDASGKVVARATPISQDTTNPWSHFPELTPEEIERRANDPGPWYSTEELKEKLRELM